MVCQESYISPSSVPPKALTKEHTQIMERQRLQVEIQLYLFFLYRIREVKTSTKLQVKWFDRIDLAAYLLQAELSKLQINTHMSYYKT